MGIEGIAWLFIFFLMGAEAYFDWWMGKAGW